MLTLTSRYQLSESNLFHREKILLLLPKIMHPHSADVRSSSRSPTRDEIPDNDEVFFVSSCDPVEASNFPSKIEQDDARNCQETTNRSEKSHKMAQPAQLLSKLYIDEAKEETKSVKAKRARVENIVTSIKDSNSQAMDLSRNRKEAHEMQDNVNTLKQTRKRLINDVTPTELCNVYKISSTVERNDDRMTEENDLHHKRRRIDVDNHALNLSSNKYDDNIVDRDFKDLSDVKNEVVRESVIFGETYNILVDSLKQELMASLEAIAKNSAKRILEELIYSQANVAGTRSKNNEISETRSKNNEISETRSSNNDNNLSLSSRISQQIAVSDPQKPVDLLNDDFRHQRSFKNADCSKDFRKQAEQTEALSLVKNPTSVRSPISPTPGHFDSYARNSLIQTSKPSSKNWNSSKSESTFYQNSKPTVQPLNTISPAFYSNPYMMPSTFGREPSLAASLTKSSLSRSYITPPPNLNSALQMTPNHLNLLQSYYQQQSLANALAAEYERIEDGMGLKNGKSHSTRTSTRDPRSNPSALSPIQLEAKTESLKCRNIPNSGPDQMIMTSVHEGLNAHHLKKAKLMFFYTRYPSANSLKNYFPDVKFTRATTSQLIKWFSNFREFFYIQIEKFARQAINDGVNETEQLHVDRESEIFRAINQHYNKNNDFRVPEEFLHVILRSLEEFFLAIKQRKDADPSWKKPIYKVICKLDQFVPALFKLPNAIDHLAKIY